MLNNKACINRIIPILFHTVPNSLFKRTLKMHQAYQLFGTITHVQIIVDLNVIN